MHAFLKWPGSKREQREILKNKLPKNFNTYIEPFAGGGSLFLYLGLEQTIINDINKQLINCYIQIRDNVNEFITKIKELDNTKIDNDYYLKLREQYNQCIVNNKNDVECAALLYWLNKRCFNGLYRINKNGLFNASWNKSTGPITLDEDNLKQVSKYLQNIYIFNQDFSFISSIAKKRDLIYIDSPYAPLTESAKFTNYNADGFNEQDHRRLADIVHKLTDKQIYIIVSNHNTELIRNLYKGYNFDVIKVSRKINTDATKRTGTEEIIITNF